MEKYLIYTYIACGVGFAMLITGLLPHNKMDKVRAFLGDKKEPENRKMARIQLLTRGHFFCLLRSSC